MFIDRDGSTLEGCSPAHAGLRRINSVSWSRERAGFFFDWRRAFCSLWAGRLDLLMFRYLPFTSPCMQEHRLGRWSHIKGVKNVLHIVRVGDGLEEGDEEGDEESDYEDDSLEDDYEDDIQP